MKSVFPTRSSRGKTALAASTLAFFTACAGGGSGVSTEPLGDGPDSTQVASAVRHVNEMALDLYRELAAREGSFIFSPAGLAQGIALAQIASSPASEGEVTALLGSSPVSFLSALDVVIDSLEARAAAGWSAPRSALWADSDGSALAKPLGKQGYETRKIDFTRPEAASPALGAWANETLSVPEDLIPPVRSADPGTHLLVSGLMGVRGHWLHPFLASQTLPGTFRVSPTVSRETGFVRTVDAYRLKVIPEARLVELPYVGLETSLFVIVPDTTFDLSEIEAGLSADSLESWTAKLAVRHVDLQIPQIDMQRTLTGRDLEMLGLGTLFPAESPLALWSASFLSVSQDGSQMTGVSPEAAPRLPATYSDYFHMVHATHPFTFLVRENKTGLLLLMGRFQDPEA